MINRFEKKIFTAGIFLRDIGFLIWNIPNYIRLLRGKHFTRVFIEKIMNVTSAVNGCVYCSWFHAKAALNCGMSKEEVKNMMNLQFRTDASEFELIALLYAQHFAETNRKPETEMTEKLYEYYGEDAANQIVLAIRAIFFANLFGNTWDAVISRFKGKPAPNSNLLFEIVYFLLTFLIAIPFTIIMKMDKKNHL